MSAPGLNPFVPPALAPAPVPQQIQLPRPGSPTLRNRPAQHDRKAEEDAASGSGLKRGRPSEAEEGGMDIESSSEPQLKRRRGEREVATPERLQAPVGNIDPRDGFIREAQEVLDAVTATSSGPRVKPLCYAASRGFELTVRYVVDFANYLDVNIAFVHAIKSGHLNIVELLHARGANLCVKDASGKGCLHYAVESRNLAVLEWLLKKSAHVDAPTTSQLTPLMQACGRGDVEAARMLHAHHANLAARDASGRSCVHYAVESGDVSVMKWLLDHGAEVNVPESTGLMPLMQACGKGNIEAARLLQAQHANLAAKDDRGRNCMYYAAAHGRQAVVDWLLAQGAPADEPDSQGVTPIFRAFSERHWPCVNSLLAAKVKLSEEVKIHGVLCCDRTYHDIYKEAIKDSQYQVLLSLYQRKPAYFDLDYPNLGLDQSMLSFSDGLDFFCAELRDLIRIFESLKKSDTAIVSGWMSESKKAEREVFVSEYIDDIKRGPVIRSDSENLESIPILDSYYIEHPLFSYVVHHCLIPDHPKWIQLTQALAGRKNDVFDKQMQGILLHKMRMLKASSGLAHVFSGKYLLPELEEELTSELLQKLDGMILAFKESLVVESADFVTRFAELCKTRMSRNFHAPSLKKALSKRLGFYSVNADRLTGLVSQAWEAVRRKPLDLPPMASVDQAMHLVSKYSVEKMLDELRRLLMDSAKVYELSVGSENPEGVSQEADDTYPRLSAQLKVPLSDPRDPLLMPGFAKGLEKLEQQEQDLYADLILGQWRKINAAFGVTLPEPFAPQQ